MLIIGILSKFVYANTLKGVVFLKSLEEFKQELIIINNNINEEMYGRKLDWQKIEISRDKIIIIGLNRRISLLKNLDGKDAFTARLIDLALLNEFKIRFKKIFEKKFGLKIRTILKDYDPINQIAGIMIITVQPAEEFFYIQQ
jgi:hypothetical protein